jgi:hypothetical protein
VISKIVLSLNTPISNLTDLLAIEAFPPLAIELFVKLYDEDWVHKIDEGIANVAFIL